MATAIMINNDLEVQPSEQVIFDCKFDCIMLCLIK